jgi:hypothetical protein
VDNGLICERADEPLLDLPVSGPDGDEPVSGNPTIRPSGRWEVGSEDNLRVGNHSFGEPEVSTPIEIEPRLDSRFPGGTRLPRVKSKRQSA